ncbi:MAG TPA: hypothetical protein VHI31_00680 [Actinomycetota bacterium]|nr:hypothetical protein [Actinomycetota bacterium]
MTATVSGGGAGAANVITESLELSSKGDIFGIHKLSAGALDSSNNFFTQAGGHPYAAVADFRPNLDTQLGLGFLSSAGYAGGTLKDVVADLPPGFVGNPMATAKCTQAQFPGSCPPGSQVGVIEAYAPIEAQIGRGAYGIYNMVPPPHLPALFQFTIDKYTFAMKPSVRADGDYGITISVSDIAEIQLITRQRLAFWGVPASPVHDSERCALPNARTLTCTGTDPITGASSSARLYHPSSAGIAPKAFITNPTNCADTPSSLIRLARWEEPAVVDDLDDPRWTRVPVVHPDHTDCAKVPFDPTIDFETTVKQADTPTGLAVRLHVPQDGLEDPNGIATSHLKRVVSTLPEGVAFNASAADGLEACTPAQIGLRTAPGVRPYRFNNVEPSCPTASKVANARVTTPLLEDQLRGEVFLASQDENPFDSTFAVYIVVREPSILVKLPGKVELDQRTGQITATFDDNPQLPFTDLEMDFFDGSRASLATPQTCGTFTTTTEFSPWSAVDPDNPAPSELVTSKDSFAINAAPGGQGCVSSKSQLPLNAALSAGSSNPIAGAKSPFDIQITRPDGSQELDKLEISPPPGFVASLKGIPYCSEAQIAATTTRESGKDELASSTCPAASQVGTTSVGAGAGNHPLYTPGKLYLAGPYKGETLSVVAVTPAVAGPFDLGNVVVRSALKINPLTARITAVTDPLPRTIEGVPLRIRDIRIALDRPNWAINPTNCEAMSVDVTAFGVDGAVSKPSNRYQLRDCAKLGFKPRLSIKLLGGTRRGAHPALLAVLKTRAGDANIARAAVTLPNSAFLDQAHIRTICTRVQYAADSCPKGAVYGHAKAVTPLLDDPIEGDVLLRSSDNKLPDLVGRLRGVANIEAVGRIDSVKGGIRNTFDVIPDAPFDTFTLRMQGGRKGLVVNSKNLCAKTNRATVKFTAQNGRRYNYRPKVVPVGCKKKVRKGKKRAKR